MTTQTKNLDPFETLINALIEEGKPNLLARKKELKMQLTLITIAERRIKDAQANEQESKPEELPEGSKNAPKK